MLRQTIAERRWCLAVCGLGIVLTLIATPKGAARAADGTAESATLRRGQELFVRIWQPYDVRSKGGDGLGPRFNERSCIACHAFPRVGGSGPLDKNVQILSVMIEPNNPAALNSAGAFEQIIPHGLDAPFVLHKFSTSDVYNQWREMLMRTPMPPGWEQDGQALVHIIRASSRGVVFTADFSGVKRFWIIGGLEFRLTERNTPAIFGDGLIDQVPASLLQSTAESQPSAVRGRVALLPGDQVGRFGWKGQNATLLDFTQNACAVELGLENPGHHQVRLLGAQADTAAFDLSQQDCDALAAFEASLPAPQQIIPAILKLQFRAKGGELVFNQIGCADCHVRDLGPARGIYSDLLLHDMGARLAGSTYYSQRIQNLGGAQEGNAAARSTEWRTPPLWGCADSGPYLHDGRAPTLDSAILNHMQQGQASADAYRALADRQRMELISFLETLRAPSKLVQTSAKKLAHPHAGSSPHRPATRVAKTLKPPINKTGTEAVVELPASKRD